MDPTNPTQRARITRARILIVDDHPGTAEMLARALSQLSPEIEVVSDTNGKSALERVKNSAIDLVITDMMMPEMNGLELIEKLRQHPGGRPSYSILITAYDVPGLKEMTRRLKVNETLIKPIHPERIRQVVGKFLEDMRNSERFNMEDQPCESFKILVADDKPDNVTLLARYLLDKGYGLVQASDGEDALAQIRAEKPDLVMLDINMPKKDGFAVLREVRADPEIAHTPVIILTANRLDSVDIQTGLNLGADDYVLKPFDRRELMARIQTKLRVKSADDHIRRHNRELSIVLKTARILNSSGGWDQILDDVLTCLAQGLELKAAYYLDFETDQSRFCPAFAMQVDLSEMKGLLELFNEVRGAILMEDLRNDPRWPAGMRDAIPSVMLIPICGRDGPLTGAFMLTHEQPAYFKPEHSPLLQAVADQVAVAVDRAHFHAARQNREVKT